MPENVTPPWAENTWDGWAANVWSDGEAPPATTPRRAVALFLLKLLRRRQ